MITSKVRKALSRLRAAPGRGEEIMWGEGYWRTWYFCVREQFPEKMASYYLVPSTEDIEADRVQRELFDYHERWAKQFTPLDLLDTGAVEGIRVVVGQGQRANKVVGVVLNAHVLAYVRRVFGTLSWYLPPDSGMPVVARCGGEAVAFLAPMHWKREMFQKYCELWGEDFYPEGGTI